MEGSFQPSLAFPALSATAYNIGRITGIIFFAFLSQNLQPMLIDLLWPEKPNSLKDQFPDEKKSQYRVQHIPIFFTLYQDLKVYCQANFSVK